MAILDKKVGWSTSGRLRTGDRLRRVTIQADFPRAETYVLEFSKNNSAVPSNLPIRAEAIVSWSVEGNWVSRRISIANGTTIQGVAQGVRVAIIDVTAPNADTGLPLPNGVDYEVSVQVTPGSRGSNKFPPFLVPAENWLRTLSLLSPTLTLPVPQDAGITSLLVEAIGVTAAGIVAINPGALIMIMEQNLVPITQLIVPGPSDHFPIMPGTDRVRLSMLTANQPALEFIQFTLFFGIDG